MPLEIFIAVSYKESNSELRGSYTGIDTLLLFRY
jgi:hypothetical protein